MFRFLENNKIPEGADSFRFPENQTNEAVFDVDAELSLVRAGSEEEAKSAFKKIARKYHPDVNQDVETQQYFLRACEARVSRNKQQVEEFDLPHMKLEEIERELDFDEVVGFAAKMVAREKDELKATTYFEQKFTNGFPEDQIPNLENIEQGKGFNFLSKIANRGKLKVRLGKEGEFLLNDDGGAIDNLGAKYYFERGGLVIGKQARGKEKAFIMGKKGLKILT